MPPSSSRGEHHLRAPLLHAKAFAISGEVDYAGERSRWTFVVGATSFATL